jgi:hypothetical protein
MPYPSRTVIPIVSNQFTKLGAIGAAPEIIYFASQLISVVVFLDDTIYDRYS